jgi:hypothetical protein
VTSTSSDTFTLSPLGLTGRDLKLGLLGSSFTGSGFDRLEFKIVENGTTIRDLSFSSPTLAASVFNDQVIDLGSPVAGSSGSIALEFDMILTTSKVGDGFDADFLVATPVPEPSSLVLGLLGTATVVGFACRRCRRRHGRRTRRA